jgi:hypothetical protein
VTRTPERTILSGHVLTVSTRSTTIEGVFPVPQEKIEVTVTDVPTQRASEVGVLQELFEFYEQPGPPEDNAAGAVDSVDENPEEVTTAPALGSRERAVLDFSSRRFKNTGRRDQAIRDEFDISPTLYFQKLNALLDDSAALAYNPTLVARLRRVREAKQQARG